MATITATEALVGQADLAGILGGAWNGVNNSGAFIPTLWSGKLNVKFYAATTFAAVSNTNWQGEISGMGDKVIIQNIPDLSVAAYTVGTDVGSNLQVLSPSVIELPIDKAWYFAFQVNDVISYQSKPNLMEMFSNDASEQLKIKIDTECFAGTFDQCAAANKGATAGAISASYNLGTDAAPVTLAANNILATITSMAAVLDEQNVPETDRFLVITPADRQILMQSNLAQAQFMGDAKSMLRNGQIGQIDRFTVYVSNLLPKAAADFNWAGGADNGKPKRHAIIAGHKSAMTFASQINKVESMRNPRDFGDFVRGLTVYGRKVIKDTALSLLIAAG
jgi:hypothetical protein